MKKIILVFSLLYSILGFGKVNIEEVYSNAKLNIDFSSSMIFSDKQNVIEKELAEWILSNPNRFEDVNQIKIAYEPKWYWGSWKKVVRGLEFVKKENVQKRIAYYEDLRKRNEEEFRRQQERKTFLTALGVAAASYLGVKIYENRYEIAKFIKENWNNSSSNYYTDNNDSKKEILLENKYNIECENKLSYQDFLEFKNKVKVDKWENQTLDSGQSSWVEFGGGGLFDLTGRKVTRKEVSNGYKYKGKVGGIGWNEYTFNSFDDYLYAVFIYSHCGFLTKKVSIID